MGLRYSATTVRDLGRVVATGAGILGKIQRQKINLILVFRSNPQLDGLHYELWMERVGWEDGFGLVAAASTASQIYKGIEPDPGEGDLAWIRW